MKWYLSYRWYQVLLKGKSLCLCFKSFHSFYLLMKRSNSKHQRSGRKQFQLKKSQVRYKKINEDMKHYNFWVLLGDLMNAIETIILFRLLLCIIRYFSMNRAVISLARPRIQYSDLYKRCCVWYFPNILMLTFRHIISQRAVCGVETLAK